MTETPKRLGCASVVIDGVADCGVLGAEILKPFFNGFLRLQVLHDRHTRQ